MRSLFTLFLVFIAAGVLSAQVITVSNEMSLQSEFVYDIIGQVGEDILVIKDGVNDFDIQAYDEDLYMTWTKEDEKLDSRKSRIINVIPDDDQFYVVYSNDWKDTIGIQVRTYNPKVQVDYQDTIVLIKRGLLRPRFRFVKSEDENIFLMTEIENERIVSAFAYNLRQRRLLWESKFDFTNINFREEYRKTIITNEGEMFLIFEKNNFRYKMESHSMEFFRYRKEDNNFEQLTVPLPEFVTYDAYFTYDNVNKTLTTVGLYSDRNTGITDGIYHLVVDRALTTHQLSTIQYDDELVADFHGKYNPKRESLYNLDIRDLVLRQDGGLLIIAEENKEYERLSYGSRRDYYGSSRFSVDYYYEDIVLVSIHPDGSAHWQKLLPKRQYSNDDEAAYSSYFLFKNPSYLRILYNDEIRNDNTVSEYILNGAGDITRRSLMSTDNQKLKLQIKNAIQLSSNEMIVPSVRGKKLKLVKFKY